MKKSRVYGLEENLKNDLSTIGVNLYQAHYFKSANFEG